MTCIRRNLDTQNCCNAWQKGIRTINQTYPDDNREFEIRAGAGIQITPITAGILITNNADVASSFAEGTNIEFTPSGDQVIIRVVDGPTFADDTTINADLIVNGDIIQRGAAYETHAEHIYTADDYIIMRDGALAGLGSGDYSGFQVKLYDGVNDGRLVIDNTGTARVGDVGDEQPLLTREESANLTDGALLKWDAANSKAVDEGTVGDDTKPIKIVNGVATAITNNVIVDTGTQSINGYLTVVSGIGVGNDVSLSQLAVSGRTQTDLFLNNTTANIQARLEIRITDSGTVTLYLRRFRLSDQQFLNDTTIATLS